MQSWVEQKQAFQQGFQPLSTYQQQKLPQDLQTLQQSLAQFIAQGGVAQDPTNNGPYLQIQQAAQSINSAKQQFQALNTNISTAIQQISSSNDMGKLLLANGQLQQQIQQLEKKKQEAEEDAKTAVLRDDLLRSQNSNITSHKLFLLGRPLKTNSIPIIWAFSVLFIGISLLIFQQLSPIPNIFTLLFSTQAPTTYPILDFLGDARVWGTLSGALLIVVLFLSLKIANVI
jgi:hypothetical protein